MPKEMMLGGSVSGIKEDTFVAFNGMLDVMLDSTDGKSKEKASAPAGLTSEAARPMPKQGELKIGDNLGLKLDNSMGNTGQYRQLL